LWGGLWDKQLVVTKAVH
jgi:hypothetical protein